MNSSSETQQSLFTKMKSNQSLFYTLICYIVDLLIKSITNKNCHSFAVYHESFSPSNLILYSLCLPGPFNVSLSTFVDETIETGNQRVSDGADGESFCVILDDA